LPFESNHFLKSCTVSWLLPPHPNISLIIINPIETNKKTILYTALSYCIKLGCFVRCLITAFSQDKPVIVVFHITNHNMHKKINIHLHTSYSHKNPYSFKTNPTPNVIPTVSRSSSSYQFNRPALLHFNIPSPMSRSSALKVRGCVSYRLKALLV